MNKFDFFFFFFFLPSLICEHLALMKLIRDKLLIEKIMGQCLACHLRKSNQKRNNNF